MNDDLKDEVLAFIEGVGIPYRLEPFKPIRRTIARRMTQAKQTIPHAYVAARIGLGAMLGETARSDRHSHPSLNDWIVFACAKALSEVPDLNAAYSASGRVAFARIDIAVAVATRRGLLTPIVKDAGSLSPDDISVQMRDLINRSREGALRIDELEGGTFTVSNVGALGLVQAAAIINPPHAAVLAVGATETRLAFDSNGTVVARREFLATLSIDHRIIDGDAAARWLGVFRSVFEDGVT